MKGTAPHARLDRRGFLRTAAGRQRSVTLRCGRLYVHYMDAVAAGRLTEFERAVRDEIGGAQEVRLVEREWLARDEFSRALGSILSSASERARGCPAVG